MKRISTIFLLFILLACGENIDLPSSPELMVVEGWINDQDTIQKIRLSKTAAFGKENEPNLIDNATVAVKSTFENFSFKSILLSRSLGLYNEFKLFQSL